MARADFVNVVRLEPPPLQIQPIVPPATPFVDTLTWRLDGQDYAQRRASRWEKFETEFGITEPEHSKVLRSVQTAKYNLDRFTFAANEFSHNLSSMTVYELGHGRIYHVSAAAQQPDGVLWSTTAVPQSVRLGLEFNVVQRGPYVGVKLVVPIGD